MSLSSKILTALVIIILISVGGFIIYKQMENARRLDDIQNSIVQQKELLDNISRAQAQYVSKEDLEKYAKDQNINLDVIKKDLETLNAQVKAINTIVAVSQSQNNTNVPSTGTTPHPNDPNAVDPKTDPYGYLTNTQHLELNEKFSNVTIPFGTVSFSAFREKPWDLSVNERKYALTSVLAMDQDGRHFSYSKLAITSGGKTYPVKIDYNQFLEEYPEAKMHWWNPHLFLQAAGGIGISQLPIKGEFTPGVAVGIMSYGKTKVNPDLSILQVGVGYGTVNRTLEFTVSPIQYNFGRHIPLMANTYGGPVLQVNTQGNVTVGAGISVGF